VNDRSMRARKPHARPCAVDLTCTYDNLTHYVSMIDLDTC
jgi:hypothetical protein